MEVCRMKEQMNEYHMPTGEYEVKSGSCVFYTNTKGANTWDVCVINSGKQVGNSGRDSDSW